MASFNRDAYLRAIRGESRGLLPGLGRAGLSAISAGYGLGVRARNLAFDRGWRSIHRADVPVIAVGNLTLGGTGKTPMVEWLARRGRREGLRVAILSRGYGQSHGINDEGLVLEENLPDVPHLQGADRVALSRIAVEELESQLLVLDDGFQHRRLARDLDVVLIDALEPFGLDRLFPRGLLREPVSGLRRAGVVVLSRADLVDEATRAAIRRHAERRAGPLRWVEARHAPIDLVDAEGRTSPLSKLEGQDPASFCGIGNPEGFRRTLERLGAATSHFRIFADHHSYCRADVESLAAWTRDLGTDLALTTQKDLVKLRTVNLGPARLFALRIGLELMSGGPAMEEALGPLLSPRTS